MADSKKTNFIVLSQNNWFGPWMNRQQLFSLIGNHHNVIYTVGAWWTWDFRAEIWGKQSLLGEVIESDNVSVVKSPAYLLRHTRSEKYDKFVIKKFLKQIKRLLDPDCETILYVFHPDYADYVEYIDYNQLVFHAFDDYSKQSSYYEKDRQREDKLLAMADKVFAVSTVLQEKLSIRSGRDIEYLPNGVDYDLFSQPPANKADTLIDITGPKIGCIGNINEKVDLVLAEHLAIARTDINFIFVGGIRNLNSALAECQNRMTLMPNVYFMGHQPPTNLPAFVHQMDINLMLYRVDDAIWTDSIYPLKMHEYLAAGKPVISSDIDSVRQFRNVIDIALDYPEWLAAIEKIIPSDGMSSVFIEDQELVAQRQRVAANNRWQQRVDEIYGHLNLIL